MIITFEIDTENPKFTTISVGELEIEIRRPKPQNPTVEVSPIPKKLKPIEKKILEEYTTSYRRSVSLVELQCAAEKQGYKLTGEFRHPKADEHFLSFDLNLPVICCRYPFGSNRLIVKNCN